MIPAIVLLSIVAVVLCFGFRSPQASPVSDVDDVIYDDDPECATEDQPLYQLGDTILLKFNWWVWKGEVDDRPEWQQYDNGYRGREVREERRAEVLAQVAHDPWSSGSIYLVFADGNITIPLSACDGSNRITYYQPPDSSWLIRSKWAGEWL